MGSRFTDLRPTESTPSPYTAWSAESSWLLWPHSPSVLTLSCSSASRPCRGFDVKWDKNLINNGSEAVEWFSPPFWLSVSVALGQSVGAQFCHCYRQALCKEIFYPVFGRILLHSEQKSTESTRGTRKKSGCSLGLIAVVWRVTPRPSQMIQEWFLAFSVVRSKKHPSNVASNRFRQFKLL